MTTVNRMRLFLSISVAFSLLISSVYGFQISVNHHGMSSLDAATKSPLFRRTPASALTTTGAELPGFLQRHNENSRPRRIRIPSSLLSLAFAVIAFAWTNSMVPTAAHAARESTTTIQTSKFTRKNLTKGVGIVLVAGGAGALVGSTLRSNKGENVITDDENDEVSTISSSSGGEPEAAAENKPKEEEQSPYQKASAKAVERILNRVKEEKYLSAKSSVSPETEKESAQEEKLEEPIVPPSPVELEKPTVVPPSPVESLKILQEKPPETLLKRTKSFTKKVNARLHGRRQPLDDPELVEKYAAIESVEDRAFQILLDLNMIQLTPNPDNPDYKYAKKETEGEEEHEQ